MVLGVCKLVRASMREVNRSKVSGMWSRMRCRTLLLGMVVAAGALPMAAQAGAGGASPAGGASGANGALDAAAEEIGRALFLRCLCAGDTLRFSAAGEPLGAVKTTDWTLAAVDVDRVEAKPGVGGDAGEIELEGVRVAIHYAADRHEFERKPQKDERVRIAIANPGDRERMRRALEAVFAEGIDRRLQQSTPELWQHFFSQAQPWSNDELSAQTIYTAGATVATGEAKVVVGTPEALHKVAVETTTAAVRDHVQGSAVLRVVVDAEGIPHRVSVAVPLGYGLDAAAAAAVAKMRFRPGTLGGKPVAVAMLLREDFVLVTPPGS
jgi:TonB family protein